MMPPSVVDDCRRAAALLEGAEREKPERLKERVRQALALVVAARDALIHALRVAEGADAGRRGALDRVNTSLSLMVGVEDRIGPLHRKALGDVRRLLAAVDAH